MHLGLKKDLKTAAQKDVTGQIAEWTTAVINHMYWSAASTPHGTPEWSNIVEAKWKSSMNHIVNVHRHDNNLYSRCCHPRHQKGQKKKKYMKQGIFQYLKYK